jgi:hypothetical protein
MFFRKRKWRMHSVEYKTCKGACIKQERSSSYNKRVKKAIAEMSDESSYAILTKALKKLSFLHTC